MEKREERVGIVLGVEVGLVPGEGGTQNTDLETVTTRRLLKIAFTCCTRECRFAVRACLASGEAFLRFFAGGYKVAN